jgi:thiosulfate/3-mercaptopyruvate sulfurtransferase
MKKLLSLIVSTVLVSSLALVGCSQKQATVLKESSKPSEAAAKYVNNDLLVSADWVKDNIDKGIVILDARDAKAYAANHIPNSINVKWQPFTDMENKKPGDKGFGNLLEPSKLADVIGKLGIDGTKTVVVYGAPPTGWAEDGRIAWTLKSAGIKDVKMLNGGWNAWKSKEYPSDTKVPTPKAVAFKISAMDESINVTTDYINKNIDKIKIIDAREVAEYNGAVKYGEARGGHLPKAINITWTQFYNSDGTLKSQKDIETLLSSKGINKDDEIVSYCTKGIRSADVTLILKIAGYEKAKNYDGSYYEWAGNKDLSVEK